MREELCIIFTQLKGFSQCACYYVAPLNCFQTPPPDFSSHIADILFPTHQPAFSSHATTTSWERLHVRIVNLANNLSACATSQRGKTHSEDSAIYPLPHTRTHRCSRLASVSLRLANYRMDGPINLKNR